MNRRTFLSGMLPAAFFPACPGFSQDRRNAGAALAGQPVNLARYGESKSWLNPEAARLLAVRSWVDDNPATALSLSDLPWKESETDLGVEWPEFRTIHRIIVRYSAGKAPRHGDQFLEHWSGLTTLQGAWKPMEDGSTNASFLQVEGDSWIYSFAPLRTCKIRLRFRGNKDVAIEQFSVLGPSKWRTGQVRIELGYVPAEKPFGGRIETYNAELLELRALAGAEIHGPDAWTARAGGGKVAVLAARLLYTWGMDVDRSIFTLRTQAGGFSFLPGLAVEDQPIEISDFGAYVCNQEAPVARQTFLARSAGRRRIIDEVGRRPEQTLEQAYANIQARRVTLSFLGVDANNHKFGIAPDGHIVVGTHDPTSGQVMVPVFAVYFETTEAPRWFEAPAGAPPQPSPDAVYAASKDQALEEGWLPILTTSWSQNELSFARTDSAHLLGDFGQDVSAWNGDEPAVLVSRLGIRNSATVAKTARLFVQPWKPATGGLGYGPMPPNVRNQWTASIAGDCITAAEGDAQRAVCYLDMRGKGALSLVPSANAAVYTVELGPGEEHVIHLVLPGWEMPAAEVARLRGLDYGRLRTATVEYWKRLRAQSMQVELPDPRLERIFHASQHHFLLAMTKDGKRGEYYPNTAMLHYGSIGSESSPLIQSLDMRGMHGRARDCLRAWLSTQGDLMPAGDYQRKEGGFYRFWPIYTVDQGAVLWALAEHYLYTRDRAWLREVAPRIVAGCDFLIEERRRTMRLDANGGKPLTYGLAPAGCVADPRDWEYSFMLNAYFYLGLKKSARVLEDADPENARRIAREAADYLAAIRRALRESVALSPVTRLRDNTSVPSVPSYIGLRGFSSDVKDSVDPDRRHGYAYDCTIGPFHLLKGEVLEPWDPEVTWMLNAFEDRFFLFTPLPSRVNLERLGTDWFNLGGFEKLQPYYVHYQDAYLQRDQIPNFVRGFYNTLASIADPQTLTFQEELDFSGAQPHKTHEEAWFFHQCRFLLVMEMGGDLHLGRGVPRHWLEHGKHVAVRRAATYFGEIAYRIQSRAGEGRIEAAVQPPLRNPPANLYLRFRHPRKAAIRRVTVNAEEWRDFDPGKEWIRLPAGRKDLQITAFY
ncbi:MAG TPA: hypothetical protein VFA33_09175 [Bryobacteraceae bacterium]|nr:hypothetical protein [Bryobacteraceae bacterium]